MFVDADSRNVYRVHLGMSIYISVLRVKVSVFLSTTIWTGAKEVMIFY